MPQIEIARLHGLYATSRTGSISQVRMYTVTPLTKYGCSTFVGRRGPNWVTNDPRIARADYFESTLLNAKKERVLAAFCALGFITKEQVNAHKAEIINEQLAQEVKGDKYQLDRLADKLGYKLTKKKR